MEHTTRSCVHAARSDAPRVLGTLALVASLIFYLVGVASVFAFQVDDTYISLRYAQNLAQGDGLVFNRGDAPIEGYTNFLLVLLEAALVLLNVDPVIGVKLLCVISGFVAVLLLFWYARQRGARKSVVLAPLLFATSSPVILWAVSGLETVLFALAISAGVALHLAWVHGSSCRWEVVADVLLALAALLRPEGLLFYGVTMVHAGMVARKRGWLNVRLRVAGQAVSTLALIGYAIWKVFYFGQLLPMTFYAKQPGFGLHRLWGGSLRLGSFLLVNGNILVLLVAAVGLYVLLRRRKMTPTLRYLSVLVVMYGAYLLALGYRTAMDDAYRFFVPLVPLVGLLLVEIEAVFASGRRVRQWIVVGFFALGLIAVRSWDLQRAWTSDLNWGFLKYRIAARDVASGLDTGHIALGRWLSKTAPPDATVVLFDAGAIPYFSSLYAIDTWSLLNPRMVDLRRRHRLAQSAEQKQEILRQMQQYVLSYEPDYIIQDNLGLLDLPAVREIYTPVDREFIYLDAYDCGARVPCRYVLRPWVRIR